MPGERSHPVPLYAQVASVLAREIGSGALTAEGMLPSENDLITRFAVSRTTVRSALSSLQSMGLIETRHGKGSFVRGSTADDETTAPDRVITRTGCVATIGGMTPADPRPVPTPFGWCAMCIREGTWLRAATLHGGTAMCAEHTVFTNGTGETLEASDFPRGVAGNRSKMMLFVVDKLREAMSGGTAVSGPF